MSSGQDCIFCCFGAIFQSVSVMIPTYPSFFRSGSHFLFHKKYKWKFAFFVAIFALVTILHFFSSLVVMFPALSLPSQTPAGALHNLTTVQYNWITFLSQIHISLADQSRWKVLLKLHWLQFDPTFWSDQCSHAKSRFSGSIQDMWQIKSVFKKIKTGIRNGQSQYYSDFI